MPAGTCEKFFRAEAPTATRLLRLGDVHRTAAFAFGWARVDENPRIVCGRGLGELGGRPGARSAWGGRTLRVPLPKGKAKSVRECENFSKSSSFGCD